MVPSRSAETLTLLQATTSSHRIAIWNVYPIESFPQLPAPELKRGSFWKLTVREVWPAGPPNSQIPTGLFL